MNRPYKNSIPELDPDLKQLLRNYSEILNEAINFGTHIMVWDTEAKRKGKDNNIPTLLFRSLIDLADSISILIRSSSIDSAKILFRSFIENRYGLLYLIEKKEVEKQRAYSFIVWRVIKDIKYHKQFVSDEPSSKALQKEAKKDINDFDFNKFFDRPDTINLIKEKESLLTKPKFKPIHKEYIRTCRKRNTKFPAWYSLFDGPKNVKELSSHLKKNIEYEFNYRKYSESVHSTNILDGLSHIGNGETQLIQIRNPEHCKDIFSSTTLFLIEVFPKYVEARVPNKLALFSKWYLEFKNKFSKINSIDINFQK